MEGMNGELQINTNKQMNVQAQRMEQQDRNLIIPGQNIGQAQGNVAMNAGVAQIQRPAYLTRLSELLTEYRSCGNSDNEGTFKPIARPLSYLVRNFESLDGKQEIKMIIDLYARANAYYNTHRGVRLSIGGRKRKNLINNIISCCEDAIMSMPDSMRADALEMMYSSDSAPIMFEKEEEHREGSLNNSKKTDEFLKRIARAELKNSIRDRDIKDSDLLNTEPMTDAELDAVTDQTLSRFGKAELILLLQQNVAKANKSRIYNIIPEGELEGYFANSKYGDDAIRLANLFAKRVFFGRNGRPVNYAGEITLENAKEDIKNLKSGDTAQMMATLDRQINEFMAIKLPTPGELTEDYIINNMPKLLRLVALNINFQNISNNTKNKKADDNEQSVMEVMTNSYPAELINALEKKKEVALNLTNILSGFIASKNFGNLNEINYVYGMEENGFEFDLASLKAAYEESYAQNLEYLDKKSTARRDRLIHSGKSAESLKYILQTNSASKEDEENFTNLTKRASESISGLSGKWKDAVGYRNFIFSKTSFNAVLDREGVGFLNYGEGLTEAQKKANEQFAVAFAEGDEAALKKFANQILDNVLNMSLNPADYINIGTTMFCSAQRYSHIFDDFLKNKLIAKVLADNPQKIELAKQKMNVIGFIVKMASYSKQIHYVNKKDDPRALNSEQQDKAIKEGKLSILESYNEEKAKLDILKNKYAKYDKENNTNYLSYLDEEKRNSEFIPELKPIAEEEEVKQYPEGQVSDNNFKNVLENRDETKQLKDKSKGYAMMASMKFALGSQLKLYARSSKLEYNPDIDMLPVSIINNLIESGSIKQKAALFIELTKLIEVERANAGEKDIEDSDRTVEYRQFYENLRNQIVTANPEDMAEYALYFASNECMAMQNVADIYSLKYDEIKKANPKLNDEEIKKQAAKAAINNTDVESDNKKYAIDLIVARKLKESLRRSDNANTLCEGMEYFQTIAKRYNHLNEAKTLTEDNISDELIIKETKIGNSLQAQGLYQVNQDKRQKRLEKERRIAALDDELQTIEDKESIEKIKNIALEFSGEGSEQKISEQTQIISDTLDFFRTDKCIVNDGLYPVPSLTTCEKIIAKGSTEERVALLISMTDLMTVRRNYANQARNVALLNKSHLYLQLEGMLEKLKKEVFNGRMNDEAMKLLAAFCIETERNAVNKKAELLDQKGLTGEKARANDYREINRKIRHSEGEGYRIAEELFIYRKKDSDLIYDGVNYINKFVGINYYDNNKEKILDYGFHPNADGANPSVAAPDLQKYKDLRLYISDIDLLLENVGIDLKKYAAESEKNEKDLLEKLVLSPLDRLLEKSALDRKNQHSIEYENLTEIFLNGIETYKKDSVNPQREVLDILNRFKRWSKTNFSFFNE